MNTFIIDIMDDFIMHFHMNAYYQIDSTGKSGICKIDGQQYLLVWYMEIREEIARKLINRHRGETILIISRKIYGSARQLFEDNKISYLEHNGYSYFVGDQETLTRERDNLYDQRLNKARIRGVLGSIIRYAIQEDTDILNRPVKQLAQELQINQSILYYFFNQLKQDGYLKQDQDNKVLVARLERFNKNDILNDLNTRGRNKIRKGEETIDPVHGNECTFHDDFQGRMKAKRRRQCEDESELLLFISPFENCKLRYLDQSFRRDFRNWYTSCHMAKRVA